MPNLPVSVLSIAEQVPAEDMAIAILRAAFPGFQVVSAIRKNQDFPCFFVRRLPSFLDVAGDVRFVESMDFAIQTFTIDPDGDRDGAILSEAGRIAFRNAWLNHFYDPALGSVVRMEVLAPPRRVSDWATASGPVQYADLPTNVWRYEARYRLLVHKPPTLPFSN